MCRIMNAIYDCMYARANGDVDADDNAHPPKLCGWEK